MAVISEGQAFGGAAADSGVRERTLTRAIYVEIAVLAAIFFGLAAIWAKVAALSGVCLS